MVSTQILVEDEGLREKPALQAAARAAESWRKRFHPRGVSSGTSRDGRVDTSSMKSRSTRTGLGEWVILSAAKDLARSSRVRNGFDRSAGVYTFSPAARDPSA